MTVALMDDDDDRDDEWEVPPVPKAEIVARSMPFTLIRAAGDTGDGLTLEGYAAVFDRATRIDSWEGSFDEKIARGAFAKTLKERTPVIQFDHGQHPLVGSIPIASVETLREDAHGLYVKARLADNWLVQPVRDAIASGAIDGMSFRFSVVKETIDESGDVPLRTVQEVRLFELGPVVFPAYPDTTVGVRDLPTDPAERLALARSLVLGTPIEAVVDDDTSDGAAIDEPSEVRDDEAAPEGTSPVPHIPARRRPLGDEERAAHRAELAGLIARHP